ncbi:hypothetical protein LTR91_020917 [Friedmanniomyces endolithicus]|uniref:Uncharacterized protein n=1 Tax=Friedmanniomyces endolithicus TaxID=329885 RepID=A0AAN6H8Z6_9PEZI|nr:hypothetical protein LTR94_002597 [Friedmanniomyces endolithicus]KAK0810559.1 hypothetical protein LTR75_005544 [Friedmanniomyces endolithicus]KAK0812510.1 hypothetical protein LTR59_001471 [Friedmanniomyces endolithicus]KAK0812623.1 hypothetical protein LTR38_003239 [Friedmanniomyces endolithicus]KAK0855155.1 hypothetical protein LTR03_001921 [Friedmanniomyces endolithicus]
MVVLGVLLLSALATCTGALPTSGPLPNYRGAVGHWDVHRPAGEEGLSRSSVAHSKGSSITSYQCFDGTRTGDPSTATARWLPFDQLWTLNEPTILSKNGGDTYVTHFIRAAIEQVSCDDEIDPALVLAIVMQEIGADDVIAVFWTRFRSMQGSSTRRTEQMRTDASNPR